MKRVRALLLLAALGVALGGCAGVRPGSCPAGQERVSTAQMFFGRSIAGKQTVSDAAFRRFLNEQLAPRFQDGLTVLDGGGQWKGEENRRIRESAKVVLIVLPKEGDSLAYLETVRQAYKTRFDQDAMLQVSPPVCISF